VKPSAVSWRPQSRCSSQLHLDTLSVDAGQGDAASPAWAPLVSPPTASATERLVSPRAIASSEGKGQAGLGSNSAAMISLRRPGPDLDCGLKSASSRR